MSYHEEQNNRKVFESVKDHIKHLEKGQELLQQIWMQAGGIGQPIPMELIVKLQGYFHYDDGE